MKYAVLLCLAAGAFGQDLPQVSPLESFFRTVVTRSRITETPPANTLAPPTIQAAIGFTDSEMASLNSIAAAFVNRASSLRAPSGEVVFQARLELADTGTVSDSARQQLTAMEAGLAGALTQASRELRSALGDERYQKFDSWLRARGASGCWVAPCSAVPRR
ncbi:MAG: hypothetical protein ABI806_16940 [Candidatus Solibacter sp.]